MPLLDRLIDADPTSADAPSLFAMDEPAIEQAIRAAIARDLEILLNTRQRLIDPPPGAPEPAQSILDFGLPAVRGTNLATAAGRNEFGRAIEGAIRCFEPRLRDVQVNVLAGATPLDPLRLVIAAKLAVGGDADPVHFEGTLATGSGRVSLQEGGR